MTRSQQASLACLADHGQLGVAIAEARIDALEATQAQLTRIIEQQNQIIAGLRPQPEPAYASNVKAIHKR